MRRRLSPLDGARTSLILSWVDTQTMTLFLRHTAQEFAESFCLMLLDGAGWHHAQNLVLPDNLRLVFLPPYSPELNPVEHVREPPRENHFGNDPFPTLEAVGERLATGLRRLGEQPDLVRSLTCFDWLNTIRLSSNQYELRGRPSRSAPKPNRACGGNADGAARSRRLLNADPP